MFYLIIKDSKILLGPVAWNPGHFVRLLELQNINVTFPIIEPNGYLQLDDIHIYPVLNMLEPPHDPIFEELRGPYWEFSNGSANGFYKIKTKTIDTIKTSMIQKIAEMRYNNEIRGISISVDGVTVFCDTSREGRLPLFTSYASNNTYPILWKFKEATLELSKDSLYNIIKQISTYIDNQFMWEKNKLEEINNATTVEELRSIVIQSTEEYT